MPIFFDVETRNTFDDVGGYYPEKLKVSVVVTYNADDQRFRRYTDTNLDELVREFQSTDLVVGFNIFGFDYPVLQKYTPFELRTLPSLDMLDIIHKQLGFRVGLDALASATLGLGKSADGLQAVRWWREGRVEEVFKYCEQDVDVTRQLYEFGKQNRYVQFYDRQYRLKKVTIAW